MDAVLVWKLDRFGRSALDLLTNPPCSTLSKSAAARITIVPRERQVAPGQPVSVDLYLEGAQDLRLYQVSLDFAGGASGQLALRDLSIDETREDYVFAGQSSVSVPDARQRRAVSALWEGGVSRPERRYLATFVFVPSSEARGLFTLRLRGEPGTLLRNSARDPIKFHGAVEATIRVTDPDESSKPTTIPTAPRQLRRRN